MNWLKKYIPASDTFFSLQMEDSESFPGPSNFSSP
jgi:hypothetical protein